MQNDLLQTPLAISLYRKVKDLPIIDYHNHLSISDIVNDRAFENITQLWITPDPYKHRAMRILGVPEHFITGNASDFEKFEKWYFCLPRLLGNPLYDWSQMEMKVVFDLSSLDLGADPKELYEMLNQKLKTLSAKAILDRFSIEYCAPCTALTDPLEVYENSKSFAPSLRGDDILLPNADFVRKLEACTGIAVNSLETLLDAIDQRLQVFREVGCQYTDHALDNGFSYRNGQENADACFEALQKNEANDEQKEILFSYMLKNLASLYAKHGFCMQLHIGAQRKTSTRLRKVAGAAGGYAAIGNSVNIDSLIGFLDDVEQMPFGLPKTLLFTLNPADNALISILCGSYSKDGVEAIISQGPAWWWCDHAQGMTEMLEHFSTYGVLSVFVGMTTDSRSLLSFVRHDYFRRILCSWLAKKAEEGIFPSDEALLGDLAVRVCYQNAKNTLPMNEQ